MSEEKKFKWSTERSETLPVLETDEQPKMIFYVLDTGKEPEIEGIMQTNGEKREIPSTMIEIKSAVPTDVIKEYMEEDEYREFREEALGLEGEVERELGYDGE